MDADNDEINKLVQQLGDKRYGFDAAVLLGEMGEAALEPVLAAWKAPTGREMHENAGAALGRIGEPAVEPLLDMLRRDEWSFSAVWVLGGLGDARAVEPIIEALRSRDQDTRWAAVHSLALLQDGRAVEPLIKSLKDRASMVRFKAVIALGEFGDERAVEPLKRLLNDRDVGTQDAARRAISKIESS